MALPAMLPEVSTTKVMSLAATSLRPPAKFGAALRKNVPSWPAGRKASREKPSRPAAGVKNRLEIAVRQGVAARVAHRGPAGERGA